MSCGVNATREPRGWFLFVVNALGHWVYFRSRWRRAVLAFLRQQVRTVSEVRVGGALGKSFCSRQGRTILLANAVDEFRRKLESLYCPRVGCEYILDITSNSTGNISCAICKAPRICSSVTLSGEPIALVARDIAVANASDRGLVFVNVCHASDPKTC